MVKNKVLNVFLFFFLLFLTNNLHAQLANFYPNDVGIESDTNVLYVEKFEDGMTNIQSRYTDRINVGGMSLDTDVPSGSLGVYSLKMTSTQGINNGGHLFKKFTPGFDSTVYVRYYVKYPLISKGYFHHESVWFGGYNPATNWPNPQAGTCELGSSRLSIAYEPIHQQLNPPGMDAYLYWGDMKSWNGGGSCYGNDLVNGSPTAQNVAWDQWICVEMMIKLNNPVTASNGELKIWQNGILVGHWGQGFPNGHWNVDSWVNNPSETPFEGFRWRTNANVNINWLWIEFYHDNPSAPSSYIKFDHLVMAKKYIGPISKATSVSNNSNTIPIQVFPNPTSGLLSITGLPLKSALTVLNVLGMTVFSSNTTDSTMNIDLSNLTKGVYFLKIEGITTTQTRKIVIH